MLNKKPDSTHYVIVGIMFVFVAIAAKAGYGNGYNAGWYSSREHWNYLFLQQLKYASESKCEQGKIITVRDKVIRVGCNDDDLILSIKNNGMTNR